VTATELERTLDRVLGFELIELSADHVRARLRIHDSVRQRFGIVHGGTYCAWAEMLASEGTVIGVAAENKIAVGLSNSTHFLRPLRDGVITAEGRPRHRGRSIWIWDVDFTDEQGRLCSSSRVTLAVRPAPEGGPRPLRIDNEERSEHA
jgi:1,4-dihydroxy-2-naphthoyl-CoA hydrolase